LTDIEKQREKLSRMSDSVLALIPGRLAAEERCKRRLRRALLRLPGTDGLVRQSLVHSISELRAFLGIGERVK
jgi:hypothetical protein